MYGNSCNWFAIDPFDCIRISRQLRPVGCEACAMIDNIATFVINYCISVVTLCKQINDRGYVSTVCIPDL